MGLYALTGTGRARTFCASSGCRIGDREYYQTDKEEGAGLDPFWGWSLLAYFMPLELETGFDPTGLTPDVPGLRAMEP